MIPCLDKSAMELRYLYAPRKNFSFYSGFLLLSFLLTPVRAAVRPYYLTPKELSKELRLVSYTRFTNQRLIFLLLEMSI